MKKSILLFLATCVTSITINQLIKTNTNTIDETKIEKKLDLNKNDHLIATLEKEYISRTSELNNAIKNNLTDSIVLINNKITINYQNLNTKLYSEKLYQLILNPEYLNNLKIQYQLNVISFDKQNHINFDIPQISNYAVDLWGEWHWYWFTYWKLHLSYNAVNKIINYASKLGGLTAATIDKITKFVSSLITSVASAIIAIVIATFIVVIFVVLLTYSNHLPGCWLGILGPLPGFGWGSN